MLPSPGTGTSSRPVDPYVSKNKENPTLEQKVEDLQSFVDKSKFCMMTTMTSEHLLASRCMALAGRTNNGIDFIFHTNTNSRKMDDLAQCPKVNLAFLKNTGEWASISGVASVEDDRAVVEKHYTKGLKAWLGDLGDGIHDGGPNDPRFGLVKVKSLTAQYALSKRSAIGDAAELAKSAVTGEVSQVARIRHIEEDEIAKWRDCPTRV